ncbi:CHASE2 domain-containing protein [Stenomitos frigidus]|uniref:Histidine kinase n=1 Tax=Stenomitos frigidus ULC18 TaxID=2107698 RepID=A0A2T1DSK4_9CYAN|nr:CHASE2 domain-containing protein [Stenomitos frigidus]PSB23489.1 histidine kinase [Stenomitos frigidus ULC18]
MLSSPFRLKVQKVDQTCLFELSWGQGQQLVATLKYPTVLTELYQDWRRVYLSFYKTIQTPLTPVTDPVVETPLRGWTIAGGSLTPSTVNWHSKLVEAEAKLLNQFHLWLRSAELFDIRATIAQSSLGATTADTQTIQVFLTCPDLELARFPWEAWEVGTDFAATGRIRIVRAPATIRSKIAALQRLQSRGRARILAILGDDTGLNFQADQVAVRSLSSQAEITFVGWQPGQTPAEVKEHIRQAIADEQGWDVLFFAGHSNETEITGGELAIAPDTSIRIDEIAPQLTLAKERGLQVAIFNSCSGLSIAGSLIDLGFSQVAVMREPIHNCVAQEFLVQFLHSLAKHKDVHESLLAACQFLRLEKNLTYPSAYLVPSLFCHPGAALFRIQPWGWKQWMRQVMPTRWEAIALSTCALLSLVPQVQDRLLDQRVWMQAAYRDFTSQVPPATVPPVLLVQIDEASVRRDVRIAQPMPINRSYLADLVKRLVGLKAPIIALDYLLDRPIGNEKALRDAVQTAAIQQQRWIVFATLAEEFEAEKLFVTEESKIAERQWALQGGIEIFPNRMVLPYADENCRPTCPFAYLLALLKTAHQEANGKLPQPGLDRKTDLRTAVLDVVQQETAHSPKLAFLMQLHVHPLAEWSYASIGIPWLQPIIDFSIPPDRIYDRVAAWRLLNQPLQLPNLPQQVVIIMAGGYTEAGGIARDQADYMPLPAAVSYWHDRLPPNNHAATFPNGNSENSPAYLSVFPGGEIHAYTIHHLLTQRLVIPIPDVWLVGVAALIGKGIVGQFKRQQRQHLRRQSHRLHLSASLAIATVLWILLSLQLYISAAVLLPFILPLVTVWLYALPVLRRNSNA